MRSHLFEIVFDGDVEQFAFYEEVYKKDVVPKEASVNAEMVSMLTE